MVVILKFLFYYFFALVIFFLTKLKLEKIVFKKEKNILGEFAGQILAGKGLRMRLKLFSSVQSSKS